VRSQSDVAAAAVLALTPLTILPAYFFFYDITPKIAVALIGIAIAILLSLRDWPFAGVRRLWAHPLGRAFCLLASAQIASLLLSTLFSSHPALSWNGGNWRRHGFVSQSAIIVLAFLVAASPSKSGLRILLRATTGAGLAAAFYGILQYFGIDPFLSPASYHVGEGITAIVRPPSTLGHADYFAGYLLYVVFLGAALAATEVKPAWKILGVLAAIAGPVAIVLSGTRGALLGLAVGAISLWIWNRPRFTRRHQVVAAGLCALGLAFYFSPAGLKLRARSQWALADLRGGSRLWLWRDSLRMGEQRLLVGFGPDTFSLEFPRYQSMELSRAYPDFYHESPHNIFLDALVSDGIPGLTILAGFAVLAWLAARRAVIEKQQRAAPYLAAALVSGVTSGLFVCFTMVGDLYFYATVALLVGFAIPKTKSMNAPREASGWRVPTLAVSLMVVAMLLYFAIQVTVADTALARAKRDLNAGRTDDSLMSYRSSQGWHTAGSSDDLYFSRALVLASRTASQQAFGIAQRAVETSEERQNAWYNLAVFYGTRNDSPNAEMCLRRAIEASPNWFKPHWALAQVLLFSGHRTEALAEAALATDLDGGKDTEVAKFLQSLHHSAGLPKAE
jgi:O-antigen ligase